MRMNEPASSNENTFSQDFYQHVNKIFSFGVSKESPELSSKTGYNQQSVDLANALLAVLWSTVPSLSRGELMNQNEWNALLLNLDSYRLMSEVFPSLYIQRDLEAMNTEGNHQITDPFKSSVCDFFIAFFEKCSDQEFIKELNNFSQELNSLSDTTANGAQEQGNKGDRYDGKNLIVPDPSKLKAFKETLDSYKDVDQHSCRLGSEDSTVVTNPVRTNASLHEPLTDENIQKAPEPIIRDDINFKHSNDQPTEASITAILKVLMSSGYAAGLTFLTWEFFHGAVCYQAEIMDSDHQVVVDKGIWSPPMEWVYLTFVVSTAISQVFRAQRLGELNNLDKISWSDWNAYLSNSYQHGKEVLKSTFDPAEVLVVSRIINFVHAQWLKIFKDWESFRTNSSSLLDADYNEHSVKVYHAVLSALTLGLYVALFSVGFFNNKSMLDVAFLALSPFILSPTLQVIISHVLEGLKQWVESASRSPSSQVTGQRSQRITLAAGSLAAIITGMAYGMPGNAVSNNAFVGAFMSTETANYQEMMGDLGPLCFFSCALFVSVLTSGLVSSWFCSLYEPSEQGGVFSNLMLSVTKYAALYALLYSCATVALGQYCSHDPFLPGECVAAVDHDTGLAGLYTQVTLTSAFFVKELYAMSQFALVDSPKMMAYLKEIFCGDDRLAGLLWLLSRPSSLGVQTVYEMTAYLYEAFNPKYVSGPPHDRLSAASFFTSLIRGTGFIPEDTARDPGSNGDYSSSGNALSSV